MGNFKTLLDMKPGEFGKIVKLEGGLISTKHLESLGVRVGKRILKVSAHAWRGPQVIKVDNVQIALGVGMAQKVLIEVGE